MIVGGIGAATVKSGVPSNRVAPGALYVFVSPPVELEWRRSGSP